MSGHRTPLEQDEMIILGNPEAETGPGVRWENMQDEGGGELDGDGHGGALVRSHSLTSLAPEPFMIMQVEV